MEKDEKRLTEHFRMDEFVYSAMAVEFGLNNALPSEVIPVIRNLTVRLLEPLRIYHRQPMYIMSGYRSEELNRLVGGAPSSQHMKGEGGRHLHGGSQPTIGGLGGKLPEF